MQSSCTLCLKPEITNRIQPSEETSSGRRSNDKINKKEHRARKVDRNRTSVREEGEGSPRHEDWEEIHKMSLVRMEEICICFLATCANICQLTMVLCPTQLHANYFHTVPLVLYIDLQRDSDQPLTQVSITRDKN